MPPVVDYRYSQDTAGTRRTFVVRGGVLLMVADIIAPDLIEEMWARLESPTLTPDVLAAIMSRRGGESPRDWAIAVWTGEDTVSVCLHGNVRAELEADGRWRVIEPADGPQHFTHARRVILGALGHRDIDPRASALPWTGGVLSATRVESAARGAGVVLHEPSRSRAVGTSPWFGVRINGTDEYPLDEACYLGRHPRLPRLALPDSARLLALEGASRRMGATHLEIWQHADTVLIRDLGSREGTTLREPGRPWQRLVAQEPVPVRMGSIIDIGGDHHIEILGPGEVGPVVTEEPRRAAPPSVPHAELGRPRPPAWRAFTARSGITGGGDRRSGTLHVDPAALSATGPGTDTIPTHTGGIELR